MSDSTLVSGKNAVRIWGFISKFVMLDRFAKTLGVGQVYPGMPIPQKRWSGEDFAGASKVSILSLKYGTYLNAFSAPG